MKYVVLLAGREGEWADAAPDQRARWHEQHLQFGRTAGEAILAGEALNDSTTATTLRQRGDRPALVDGPFTEGVEQIGGFYLLQAPSIDQVIDWCTLLPQIYAIEIRPCVQVDGFD